MDEPRVNNKAPADPLRPISTKAFPSETSCDASAADGSLSNTETPKKRKAGSRRTRSNRSVQTPWEIPPRAPPTDAENAMLRNLGELRDVAGGLKNEDVVLTMVMIMNEEKRPLIHEALLEVLLQTSGKILAKLLALHRFLPVLHHWLHMYTKNESWSEIVIKILQLFGKLPMTRDDTREVRVKLKKLGQNGLTPEIRSTASGLFEQLELKRTKSETLGQDQKRQLGTLSRMDSWPKRKAGKAYITIDPESKSRTSKPTKRRFSPLTASHLLRRSSGSSTPSGPQTGVQQPFQVKPMSLDALPPEASQAVNRFRLEKQMKAVEAPSQLIHSMNPAPADPVFYAQQRALYDELRSEERQSLAPWEDSGQVTQSTIEWTPPVSVQLPLRDVIRVPSVSVEKESQEEREQSVPASDSGVLFSSSLDGALPRGLAPPVCPIPFFPRNEVQYKQQRKVLEDAGVALAALLGLENLERSQTFPPDPFPAHFHF